MKRIQLLAAFAAGLASAVLIVGTVAGPSAGAAGGGYVPNAIFVVSCGFSHRNTDDLIRYPKRRGASHNHTYVGNESASAFSTLATLRAAPTTCDRKADTAAYWMPTLYADGRAVVPGKATVYYRRSTAAKVVAFPPGFRMVAGDAYALPRTRQGLRVVSWSCHSRGAVPGPPSATAPACPPDAQLELQVTFPSCWDGRHLDAPDHTSHVAYPVRLRCPAKHAVALPTLTLVYQYPPVPAGATLILASGGLNTGHADFVNSWNQKALVQLVSLCLNEARNCGRLPPRE